MCKSNARNSNDIAFKNFIKHLLTVTLKKHTQALQILFIFHKELIVICGKLTTQTHRHVLR